MNRSMSGHGVICGSGFPVRSDEEIMAVKLKVSYRCKISQLIPQENLQMTARTSPWKPGSMNRVLRRNARAQGGSICSRTDIRCESEYEIPLFEDVVSMESTEITTVRTLATRRSFDTSRQATFRERRTKDHRGNNTQK